MTSETTVELDTRLLKEIYVGDLPPLQPSSATNTAANSVNKDFYRDFISEIAGRGLPGTDLPLIVKHMETTHADELLNSDADIKNYTKELLSTVIPDIGSASAEIVLMMTMMVETVLKQDTGKVRSVLAGDRRLAMELTLKFEEIINRLIGNWPMKDKYGLEMSALRREIEYMKRNGPVEQYESGTNENSYTFFKRVYGKYLQAGVIYQDDIFRIDGRLYGNLNPYARHVLKKSLSEILPSRKDRVKEVAASIATQDRDSGSPRRLTRTARGVIASIENRLSAK